MEYRHYEIVIKETGSPLPLTTAYVGFTDPAGLTAFFGLEEDDVEWYVIEEILSRTGMKTIRRIRWRNHNRYSNMNKKKNTEMTEKYLAIEIHGEIFVMNDNDGLGGCLGTFPFCRRFSRGCTPFWYRASVGGSFPVIGGCASSGGFSVE